MYHSLTVSKVFQKCYRITEFLPHRPEKQVEKEKAQYIKGTGRKGEIVEL